MQTDETPEAMGISIFETAGRISSDLAALGIRTGDTVLVHSSFKSLGPVAGGIETLILGLLRTLDGGTLALPALSYDMVDWDDPAFDVKATPSYVGAVPECFRLREGVGRSIHLTHSVCAAGPGAERLLSAHHLDGTPCGPHSPYARLKEMGGKILMLGCGLLPNTSMHGVEELTEPPYLFGEGSQAYRATGWDGTVLRLRTRLHDFTGFGQRYDRMESILKHGTEIRFGPVLEAEAVLIEAEALWERANRTLAADPFAFVEPEREDRE